MRKLKKRFPERSLASLCALFGRSRQAYYQAIFHHEELAFRQAFVLQIVAEIRGDHPRMGARKLRRLIAPRLEEHGIEPIGRDRLFDLLSVHGMLVRRTKRRAKTTNSMHGLRIWPDLAKGMLVFRIEQLWVADITYIRLATGFAYLSLLTDAYSRLIVGHCLYPTLETAGPRNALRMGLERRGTGQMLIHHSDRGVQYCSGEYTSSLQKEKIVLSMTRDGNPYDNALAERMNGILKQEYGLEETFADFRQAREQVERAVRLYNEERPHTALDLRVPAEVHWSAAGRADPTATREFDAIDDFERQSGLFFVNA